MTTPEFHRPFPVDKLRNHPMHEHIEANAEECEALAVRLDLVAIKALEADLQLTAAHGGMVEALGRFTATIVQNCVVSLEPFEAQVQDDIRTYYARAADIPKTEDVDVDDDRSPEPIEPDGTIDLGELAAQSLSLALDPYPRKPGAAFTPPDDNAAAPEEKKQSPFAVLANLADYRNKER